MEASHISLARQDQHVPIELLNTSLFMLAHDAIIVRDAHSQHIYLWNSEAEKLYGLSWQEAIGQNYIELLQPRVLMGEPDNETLLEQEGEWQGELAQRRHDNQEVIVQSRQTLIYDHSNKRSLVLEINQDLTERRRLEQTVKEYVQLTTAAEELGIWFWDFAKQFDQATNYREKPLILPPGIPVDLAQYKTHVHPDDWQPGIDAANQALQTHHNYTKELRIIEPNGQMRWLLICGRPIYDEQGNPLRLMGVALDITERKQAEELLRTTSERIRVLLESIPDALVHLDEHWRYTYVNALACQYIGRPKNALLGNSIWDLFPETLGTSIEKNLRQVMITKQAAHFEEYAPVAGLWFLFHVYPALDGIVMHFQDISERKQIEETLRASETKLRRLVDANIIGIAVVTLVAGRFLEANDVFLSLVGYTREELQAGLSWITMTPPEYQQADKHAVQELYQHGICKPYEKAFINKEGKLVPVLIAAARLENTPDQCICFILDIAEQKDLEKQREVLLGVIGHELRTPLTAIKGNLQLAQRRFQRFRKEHSPQLEQDSASLAKIDISLEQAHRQIRVQERLINDLLESTRIADSTLTITPQPGDLLPIIRDTVEDMHFIYPERVLLLELPVQEVVQVNIDADRVGQVLANYIMNAFKYSPEDKPVRVGMDIEEHEVRVWVRDEGPGIPPEVQQQIWERFYRASNIKNRSKVRSFGLGLHVSRALIAEHGGQVGVESRPGEGSTFWFTLPR